jgi:tRNA A-37 threonylcarbamoyl transferase component Bud32
VSEPLRWLAGDASLRPLVESAGRETGPARVLVETPRRRVLQVPGIDDEGRDAPLVLKHFRPRAGVGPGLLRRLGRSAAAREWRMLGTLAARDLPVPARRALAARGSEAWLLMDWVPGRPAAAVLRAVDAPERRALLGELGALVRRLHLAGIAHGDLHLDNILWSDARGPVLLDWQRARATRSQAIHARDIASLEFALARIGVRRTERLRLRRAALGTTSSRERLIAAGARADAFALDHYRGRTRRSRLEGPARARLAKPLGPGMRQRDLADTVVRAALDAHAAALDAGGTAVLKDDARARVTRLRVGGIELVAKEVTKGGLGRRLVDPLRGSPAERGWVGGHGLRARGIGAARPLAWVAHGGSRGGSILLLEDVGDRGCLETAPPDAIEPDVLLRLLLALHRRGVDHGDLQASHIYGIAHGAPVLIDLEGVRFPRRLGDEARLRALAELNASLPEESVPADERRELFRRYALALPFAMPAERALREVVQRSLARGHAWAARDCAAGGAPLSPARR